MSHMDALHRTLTRPNSEASKLSWFFLVSDLTFIDVRALLRSVSALPKTSKGYYGQVGRINTLKHGLPPRCLSTKPPKLAREELAVPRSV